MSSTNSANPIACSAGIAVIDEIKNKKLTYKSKLLGKVLAKELKNMKEKNQNIISNVFSKGLVGAVIFNKKIKRVNVFVKKITLQCLKNGLLVVYTGRESIKIGPPLVITYSGLKKGLKILQESIGFINKKKKF